MEVNKSSTKAKEKVVKKRNWVLIVYPTKNYLDSIGCTYDGSDGYGTAPDNWRDILQETGCPCAISPLHKDDKNVDKGLGNETPKKPHWHVIICYNGPQTFNVVKQLTTKLNTVIPQPLDNIKGYYRYLTHKDNPDKAQYNEEEIIRLNGFTILDYADMTRSELVKAKKAVREFIVTHEIYEYSVLIDMLCDEDLDELFDVASSNTVLFNAYIRSRRFSAKPNADETNLKVDEETGEVIE